MAALELPSRSFYMRSTVISLIPKTAAFVFSIVIYAFRTELFFAEIASRRNPLAEDRKLPLDICYYEEPNNDIYGDRICNNTMATAVTSMLLAIVLMIIDLHMPCTSSTCSKMAYFLGILWGSVLAVYWLITGALLADLYDRYCDDLQTSNDQCNDIDKKFILMPTTAFFCMTAWILQTAISLTRWMYGK